MTIECGITVDRASVYCEICESADDWTEREVHCINGNVYLYYECCELVQGTVREETIQLVVRK